MADPITDKNRKMEHTEVIISLSRPSKKICTAQDQSDKTASQRDDTSGVLTSRLPSAVPLLFTIPPLASRRLRISDESAHVVPEFANCPDWAKPLMFAEYQVAVFVVFVNFNQFESIFHVIFILSMGSSLAHHTRQIYSF